MIIDAFTYFKEQIVLECRLRELYDSVDYFILCEANHTQTGNPKPFYFEDTKHLFRKYLSKIIHVKVTDFPINTGAWAMENHQRNRIMDGVMSVPNLSDDDILMISDCDEIPRRDKINEIVELSHNLDKFSLPYSNRAFLANLEVEGRPWIGTVVTKIKELEKYSPQDFRDMKDLIALPANENYGWHLSYLGGKNLVYEKFFSCIEPFDKSKIPSFDEFSAEYDRKIKDGGSFLFSDKRDDSVKLNVNNDLPGFWGEGI